MAQSRLVFGHDKHSKGQLLRRLALGGTLCLLAAIGLMMLANPWALALAVLLLTLWLFTVVLFFVNMVAYLLHDDAANTENSKDAKGSAAPD